jgi:hypothetical protein
MGDLRVHTIDARDNVMLEVLRKEFDLSPDQIFNEIQGLLRETTAALANRGISYDSLGPALVPSQKRQEAALFFDSSQIADSGYGYPVFERVIPLFVRQSYHSVLTGDLLDHQVSQARLHAEFEAALVPANAYDYLRSNQFFCVYMNNLTPHMIASFHDTLSGYRPYVGYADCTYDCFMKRWLSTCLPSCFIKAGATVIQPHEDDLDSDANQNTVGYPFEDFDYAVKSVPSTMYETLLSYKIERPVIRGFETDTEFSLNAVSRAPSRLEGYGVQVEPAKLDYLLSNKLGSLELAGLTGTTPEQLGDLIQGKLQSSYIYNLRRLEQHDVVVFNVIIEINRCRLMASLHYTPESQTVRLVTMY